MQGQSELIQVVNAAMGRRRALTPRADESGLQHCDQMLVLVQDRPQLLDVAQHDRLVGVAVGGALGLWVYMFTQTRAHAVMTRALYVSHYE